MKLYKIAAIMLGAAAVLQAEQRPVRRDLLVAAAASLSGIAQPLTQAFHDDSGIDVRFNFAGSNTLARQIVEGARVDVFVSADEAQMDAVERAGHVVPGTRVDVIGNQLMVIRRGRADGSVAPFVVDDLGSARVKRLTMGDPAAVPAGVYGRRWLESIRLWPAVEPKVIPLPSSPAVVAAVREGRADAGIVYRSDVAGQNAGYLVPLEDSPRIVYPAAAMKGGRIPFAQRFIAFLRSRRAQDIFASAGFRPLDAH